MTEEERKRRLAEMMSDADAREDLKHQRIARADAEDAKIKVEEPTDEQARFINDMNKKVYTQTNDSLSERIRKNIHFVQRNTGTALSHEEGGI
ncbi:hypothetical protein PROFUN_10947 [Planoprotostelium fungivorum]|uniref:Uncharacterized protein n=1 Tax=Planoprotostelium fungivorum TaxID=1890364 RepID=A0A2P6NBU0_9EUKA|nr:hypothetical protein PROFUN_10947 [Planoprotostelium fungivorum]